MAGAISRVQVLWKMDLPFGMDLPHDSVLEDVSPRGNMLLRHGPYSLVVWRPGAITPIARISLSAWPKNAQELWASTECKFISGESRIVCAHGSWLALIDVQTKKEIRHVMGTEDYSGLAWDSAAAQMSGKVPLLMPSSPVVVAADAKGDRVAVAYNALKNPKILVFSPDLRTRIANWDAPKYVQTLFWSPDGKRLGVLYCIAYDEPADKRWKWTGWHPEIVPADVPDVSIFDARSWKKLFSFATAGIEAKSAFSPDGKLIYVITRSGTIAGYWRGGARDTLRAFSSTTGKLIRTFKVRSTGVRDNFAVSPDGRFIAADCTKDTHSDLHYLVRLRENLGGDITAGFVILDANTGRVIFRKTRRMFGEMPGTLPMFFSAKDDLVTAEFGEDPDQLVVYSIGH